MFFSSSSSFFLGSNRKKNLLFPVEGGREFARSKDETRAVRSARHCLPLTFQPGRYFCTLEKRRDIFLLQGAVTESFGGEGEDFRLQSDRMTGVIYRISL